MAKKKKRLHYYILLCAGNVHIFLTIAHAQVDGYYILKELTGNEEQAKDIINSIDDKFQTPPYPPKHLPVLDVSELEKLINDIALEA